MKISDQFRAVSARKGGFIVNIAIAILAITFVVLVTVDQYSKRHRTSVPSIAKSSGITLPGVNWNNKSETLVAFVTERSTESSANVRFYQRLQLALKDHQDLAFVAAFPDPFDNIDRFLSSNNLSGLQSVHASVKDAHVDAIPTLLLVSNSGEVLDVWPGELGRVRQEQVLDRVGLHDPGLSPDWLMSPESLKELTAHSAVTLLDVRDRANFKNSHVDGSINIPLDELPVRAINELDPKSVIALDGRTLDPNVLDLADMKLAKSGFERVVIIR